MAGRILKYFKIFYIILKINLVREMQYRFNFVFGFFIQLAVTIVNIAFYEIVYAQTDYIGSWDKYHTFLLIGSYIFVNCIYLSLVFHNLSKIPVLVIRGKLDFYILKPLSTRFLISFSHIDFGSCFNAIIGLFLVFFAIHKIEIPISVINIVMYFFTLFLGFYFLYNTLFLLMVSSFWFGENTKLRDWFSLLLEFSNKPSVIFPQIIKIICYFIFPLFLIANIPVEFLLGERQIITLFIFIALTILYHLISQFVWKKGLKLYSSASN